MKHLKNTATHPVSLSLVVALTAACTTPMSAEPDGAPSDATVDVASERPREDASSADARDANDLDAGRDATADQGPMLDAIAEDAAPLCSGDGGLSACDGGCVDLASDEANCGACGRACGADERCASARCEAVCRIDGARYDAGAVNPSNPCERCDPALSSARWSPAPDRTVCGAGRFCAATVCAAGCVIAGAFVADGAADPGNECRACVASVSSSAYTARSDGSTCGSAQFCTAGACGPTWRSSMPTGLTPAYGGSAASTLDGRVVLFGGVTTGSLAIVQIYNPATNTITRGPDAPYAPYRSCAVRAPNGRIYVMGGQSGSGAVATTAVYDPATNLFSSAPPLPAPSYELGCALGNNGRIYAFVADDAARAGDLFVTAHTYILDPMTNTWSTGAPMPTPRQRATAVTLRDGRIVVSGGHRGFIFGGLSQINEIYNPATNTWTTGAPQPPLVYWNMSALRSDGRVVITGGSTAGGLTTATYVYDPALDRWAAGTPNAEPHYAGYMAATPDGRLYLFSGRKAGTALSDTVEALY